MKVVSTSYVLQLTTAIYALRSVMHAVLHSEMGIYRDNLSAIIIGDNFLSIIVIAQNNLDLSITVIAFVIFFVIADKLSR